MHVSQKLFSYFIELRHFEDLICTRSYKGSSSILRVSHQSLLITCSTASNSFNTVIRIYRPIGIQWLTKQSCFIDLCTLAGQWLIFIDLVQVSLTPSLVLHSSSNNPSILLLAFKVKTSLNSLNARSSAPISMQ